MTKDEATMADVYQIVKSTVGKQIRSVRRFGEEEEDVAQEVMIKVLKNWDRYKGDCQVSSWIYSIVRNTIINLAVKHGRVKRKAVAHYSIEQEELDFEDEEALGVDEILIHDDKIHRLIALVDEVLSEDEKKVFRGLLKGYSLTKISDVFDLSYVKVVEMAEKVRALRLEV